MSPSESSPSPRSVGRPRSAEADRKILEAASELLITHGYDGLKLEHVAGQAGVGKATIYRRWPSKEHLAAAVLEKYASPAISVPNAEDTRTELRAIANNTIKALTETPYGPVVVALMSRIATDTQLGDIFRKNVVQARRRQVAAIIERGIERGDLRADTDVTVAAEALVGPVYYRLIFGGSLDAAFATAIVETVLLGWANDPSS